MQSTGLMVKIPQNTQQLGSYSMRATTSHSYEGLVAMAMVHRDFHHAIQQTNPQFILISLTYGYVNCIIKTYSIL